LDAFQGSGTGCVQADVRGVFRGYVQNICPPGGAILQDALPGFNDVRVALTFKDIGTYTFNVDIGTHPRTTFHVAVLPSGSGNMVFAGAWDASTFYPKNTIVTTGSFLTGFDFWIEASANG